MRIAQTINQQLRALTPTNVFWSWGASKFQAVGQNQIEGIGEQYYGGLMFYVRGMLHKGHVLITLNAMDEYTVTIGSVRKGKMSVKKQVNGVHFDMLGTIIDDMIEKQDNYKY